MPGRLTYRSGERTGTTHLLVTELTTIGRADDNTVAVPCHSISGRHAEIRWDGRAYVLSDLGSKNGTWLNRTRLTEPRQLNAGDMITLPCQPPVDLAFDVVQETETLGPEALEGIERALGQAAVSAPASPAGGGLVIDTRTAEVWARGRQVTVTAKEYQVLLVLSRRDGGLVSRQDLAQEVWPEYGGAVGEQNIEQLIYRLRRKLEADPEHPRHLITVRGLGYRLVNA